MTLVDTADIYGLDDGLERGASEQLLGDVFAETPGLRERVVLATKCGIIPGVPYDSSPASIRAACEASLKRLRVDVIDLYQIHRPDWLAHPEAVAEALSGLRQAGLVREIGVSNHTAAQFAALQAYLPFPIATHQPELSAWELAPLRDGVLDQCLERRVTPLAWSPLARGALGLTREEALAQPEGQRLAGLLDGLDRLAAEKSASRTAVALAFLLVHPAGVIPILGTQRPERIREGARAVEVELTRSEWYDVVEASLGEKLP